MIRFIIKRKQLFLNGGTLETIETVDGEKELEAALTGGGQDEYSYDLRELIGAEVIPEQQGGES